MHLILPAPPPSAEAVVSLGQIDVKADKVEKLFPLESLGMGRVRGVISESVVPRHRLLVRLGDPWCRPDEQGKFRVEMPAGKAAQDVYDITTWVRLYHGPEIAVKAETTTRCRLDLDVQAVDLQMVPSKPGVRVPIAWLEWKDGERWQVLQQRIFWGKKLRIYLPGGRQHLRASLATGWLGSSRIDQKLVPISSELVVEPAPGPPRLLSLPVSAPPSVPR